VQILREELRLHLKGYGVSTPSLTGLYISTRTRIESCDESRAGTYQVSFY